VRENTDIIEEEPETSPSKKRAYDEEDTGSESPSKKVKLTGSIEIEEVLVIP